MAGCLCKKTRCRLTVSRPWCFKSYGDATPSCAASKSFREALGNSTCSVTSPWSLPRQFGGRPVGSSVVRPQKFLRNAEKKTTKMGSLKKLQPLLFHPTEIRCKFGVSDPHRNLNHLFVQASRGKDAHALVRTQDLLPNNHCQNWKRPNC